MVKLWLIFAQLGKGDKALNILEANRHTVWPWVQEAGITNTNHQEVKKKNSSHKKFKDAFEALLRVMVG